VAGAREDRRAVHLIELSITPASPDDIDAIDEIEHHSFKSPWSRSTFEGELLREWARLDVGRIGSRIVTFANYWLVLPRGDQHAAPDPRGAQHRDHDREQAAFGELHLLAIATHPDHRGRGIATTMLAHVLDAARSTGCSLATLEVRRSNTPAIALYERAGFKTVHVRTRYYQDDGEDALVMLRDLTPQSP
jgi:[ribosomal protein S18]-alanine N-acetyltransferase